MSACRFGTFYMCDMTHNLKKSNLHICMNNPNPMNEI